MPSMRKGVHGIQAVRGGRAVTNPTWFLGTIWKHLCNMTMEQLAKWFQDHHAKEGVIGLEISPTSGMEHYQFKIHLDRGETIEGWRALIGPMGHIDVAVEKKFTGYEEKDGKFIKWPASPIEKYKKLDLLDWQKKAMQMLENQNDREILVIVDRKGARGKSTWAKHLEANKVVDVCPVYSDEYNDYTSYCMEYPAKGYLFDIPKAGSIKRRNAMWCGIEHIKDGLLFEKRYKPRKMWIEPPKIVITTNDEPPYELLSLDRWRVLDLDQWDEHKGNDLTTY